MRVIENSHDYLVVRDRSHLAALGLVVIALIFAGVGSVGFARAEDRTEQLVFGVFAVLSFPIAFGSLFIIRTHLHVFDRKGGVLHSRVKKLLGAGKQSRVPLAIIRGAVVETDEDVDGDTHRVVLVLEEAGREGSFPLRDYKSSSRHDRIVEDINSWLEHR